MLLPYIITFVMLLVSFAYMATNSSVADASKTKLAFTKVSFIYPRENVIVTGVENLCQAEPSTCAGKYSDEKISLTISDLNGYIPSNFSTNNGVGGSISGIVIKDNNTTIELKQDIPGKYDRKIYLQHYKGAEYGIYPTCESGSKTTNPPCDTNNVLHQYPTSLALRIALENA